MILKTDNLCTSFGGVEVTKNIFLRIVAGERRVFLGPNGAGKTTLFNLLTGDLRPSSGDILLDGKSIKKLSVHQRSRKGISRSYQKNTLFEELTVRENLLLAASAGMGKTKSLITDCFCDKNTQEIVEQVALLVSLPAILDSCVKHISYGNRRLLEIGLALATKPRILLMDEPTSGVGPAMIDSFHKLIEQLPRDLTIIIIEHDLDIAFQIASSITVLNYGKVIFEGSPEETKNDATVRNIYLGDWQKDA